MGKTIPKNGIIKFPSTLSVLSMKIQAGHGSLPRSAERGYLRYRARIFQGARNFGNSTHYIYTKMKKFLNGMI